VAQSAGREEVVERLARKAAPSATSDCSCGSGRSTGPNYEAYGYRRTWKTLLRAGEQVPRCQVQRLMAANSIRGAKRRGKPWRTTIRVPGVRVADDLVERRFRPAAPLWIADMTYLRTWEGWLYLAAVQDAYSRRIVGWSMADHMRAELVVDALQMALAHSRPAPGLVWHSDQGSLGNICRGPTAKFSTTTASSRASDRLATPTTTPWPRASRPS